MVFEKIIVMGSGKIALEVLKSLVDKNISVISYKPHSLCILKDFCQKHLISYLQFQDRDIITQNLLKIQGKTLIISANNNYIFPKEIIEKKCIKIINFHNSLLPSYKGVNAPIWSIYHQEKITGVTWHIVNSKLDSGDIIAQKQIKLTPNITSIALIKQLMDLGANTFEDFKKALLEDKLQTFVMQNSPYPPKKAKDLPNGGFLDIKWENSKISAFLRSMDTKNLLPKPKILLCNDEYIIEAYATNEIPLKTNSILLKKSNIYLLLKNEGGGGRESNPVVFSYFVCDGICA